MNKISIVGLGAMGLAMAENLLGKGYAVTGYDLRESAREALSAAGGLAVDSCAKAGAGADAVILMVFNAEQVEDVLFGSGALEASMKRGAAVIIMATVGEAVLGAIQPRLSGLGIHLVDATVRASSTSARAGEMYIMCAADDPAFEASRSLLNDMGSSIVRVGSKPGMAQEAKTCMQAFFSLAFQSTFEVLALGKAAGLDLGVLYQILNSTGAASGLFRNTAAHVASRTFEGTGNPLSILSKDAQIGVALAHSRGLSVPALEATSQSFAAGMELYPEADIWAGIRVLEEPAGLEVAFDIPE